MARAYTNAAEDVFIHDRLTGLTERVTVDGSGAQANQSSARGTAPLAK